MAKDEQLISGILSEIVENWSKEYVKHLKNELVQLTLRDDSLEYVYRTAKEILEEHKLQ